MDLFRRGRSTSSMLRMTTCCASSRASLADTQGWNSKRSFYSGLDESRLERLRRSGLTFNKPRGRDTMSRAFEKRIRVRPLNAIGDLYSPPDHPPLDVDDGARKDKTHAVVCGTARAGSPVDPLGSSSEASSCSRDGAAQLQTPTAPESTRTEKIVVVDSVTLNSVEQPVPFPSMHPLFYQARRAAGETSDHPVFQVQSQPASPFAVSAPWPRERGSSPQGALEEVRSNPGAAVAAAGSLTSGPPVATLDPEAGKPCFFRYEIRRRLRRNGDTALLPDVWHAASPHASDSTLREFFVVLCVDPFLDVDQFRREEAQVEMISGYRNILYEAAELPVFPLQGCAGVAGGTGGRRNRAEGWRTPCPGELNAADVVRILALSCYTCGDRFLHDIGKLSQQSLIKGFHRLSNEAKERLLQNKDFTVELFVPPLLLEQFTVAFAEEAWETPTSVLDPGRTALYPGLAPPRTLLQYDGWVGKRPELIEAVETEGKSLLRGPKRSLDGNLIQQEEVLSQIRIFGGRAEELKRLECEQATAQEQLGVPAKSALYDATPLTPGLQTDE